MNFRDNRLVWRIFGLTQIRHKRHIGILSERTQFNPTSNSRESCTVMDKDWKYANDTRKNRLDKHTRQLLGIVYNRHTLGVHQKRMINTRMAHEHFRNTTDSIRYWQTKPLWSTRYIRMNCIGGVSISCRHSSRCTSPSGIRYSSIGRASIKTSIGSGRCNSSNNSSNRNCSTNCRSTNCTIKCCSNLSNRRYS